MRLTLVIPALTCGGAERVLSILANEWAAAGRDVTMLTLDDGLTTPFFPLDPRVGRVSLDLLAPSRNAVAGALRLARRATALRRAVLETRPDAVVSFTDRTNVLTLLATAGSGVPVVVSERNDPTRSGLSSPWTALRRFTYPRADAVVLQTERAASHFAGLRAAVIPNPVPAPRRATEAAALARPTVVALGRLVPAKGFDVLLSAFAAVSSRFSEWTLAVFGEGPEREALEAHRRRLGLDGRVVLPGRTPDPSSVLRAADLFVLSSRTEGFPNALCEAMAHGRAVVSTDCPSGPSAIVRDGVDGLLVAPERPDALADAMARLMASDDERRRLGLAAESVCERFSVSRVVGLWDDVVARAVAGRAAA